MKFYIQFALLFLLASGAFAEGQAHVTIFAFGGVGYAGVTSEGEKEFNRIYQREAPLEEFIEWYERGHNEEKTYCMTAFYELDRNRYLRIKKQYQNEGIEISTMDGCLAGSEQLDTILKRIESGRYEPYYNLEKLEHQN
ncbi:MAG: hypothetical protein ABF329_12145 [Lentimonas sp.]